MSSPFKDAFSQRADKVSTALNRGDAQEAAYQLRGMVEDDRAQALACIRAAASETQRNSIDMITQDKDGNIYIVNRCKGQMDAYAGCLGSNGQDCSPQPEPANICFQSDPYPNYGPGDAQNYSPAQQNSFYGAAGNYYPPEQNSYGYGMPSAGFGYENTPESPYGYGTPDNQFGPPYCPQQVWNAYESPPYSPPPEYFYGPPTFVAPPAPIYGYPEWRWNHPWYSGFHFRVNGDGFSAHVRF